MECGDVEDDQRLVDVHFEITAGAAKADRHVIGHDLHGDHRQSLGLGWIHLARHDRRTRFVFRNDQLSKAGPRTARHQANVVANLVKRGGQRAHRAGELDERVVGALNGELVGRADEGQSGEPGDLRGGGLGEPWGRVDAGAHGGSSEREVIDTCQRRLEPLEIVGEHARIA